MALSTAVNGATPAVNAVPVQPKSGDTIRKRAHQDFKDLGESIGEKMSLEEKALEGTKCGAIQFVCAIGNPKQKQDRVSGGQAVPCFKPVGYKFKALEDVSVPCIPLKEDQTSLIDVDVAAQSEVKIKKGTEFQLNLREYGELISRTEYNGIFNGGGQEVYVGVTFSGDRTEPYPILKSSAGSVKANMDLIANVTETSKDGKVVKSYEVKPEYAEKFAVLLKTRSASRTGKGGTKSSEAGQSAKAVARALSAYYAKA